MPCPGKKNKGSGYKKEPKGSTDGKAILEEILAKRQADQAAYSIPTTKPKV